MAYNIYYNVIIISETYKNTNLLHYKKKILKIVFHVIRLCFNVLLLIIVVSKTT
jgi:hypothetical protein